MKRTRICAMLATFGLVCLWAASTRAQQDVQGESRPDGAIREPGQAQTEPAEDQPDARAGRPSQAIPDHQRLDPRTRYRVATLQKLQNAMKREFDLSADQAEAIDSMFRDQVRALTESVESRQSAAIDPERTAKVKELRKQVAAARDAGDTETIRKLREEFKQIVSERPGDPEMDMAQFVSAVAEKLGEGQRQEFRTLARNLGVTNVLPTMSNRDLFLMRRAIVTPGLDISDKVRKEILGILKEARITIGEVQSDEVKVKEILDRIHQEISQRLTPEQLAKFEDAVANPFRDAQKVNLAPAKEERTDNETPAKAEGAREKRKDD